MEKIIVKRFISLSLDTFIDSGVMPINLIESSINIKDFSRSFNI